MNDESRDDPPPRPDGAPADGVGPPAAAPPPAAKPTPASAPEPGAAETHAPPHAAAPEPGVAPTAEPASQPAATPEPAAARPSGRAPRGWLDLVAEPPEVAVEVAPGRLATQSRRDFLLLAAGAIATGVGGWWLLPDQTRTRLLGRAGRDRLDTLAARIGLTGERRERLLDRALTFDDDVAEALYSKDRRVRTYRRSDVTPLKNNYHGRTPGPEILPGWTLALSGLASGREERLTLAHILARFPHHEEVTRLVCVEGWSAVAWWGGIRFADLLAAYPPAPGSRWVAMRSTVSLDRAGRPETYYVSIDLPTALHPQTLLVTHKDGQPLPLAHGAPLRLIAPMKLGLKNIKAITDITYAAAEPPDYWRERGYSAYDGL